MDPKEAAMNLFVGVFKTYDEFVARAIKIAAEVNSTYVDHPEFTKLSVDFDAGVATLSWPDSRSGYYGSTSIETQSTEFPLALLGEDDEAIAAHAAAAKAERDKAEKKADAERKKQAEQRDEQRERAEFARLKEKYDGK